MFSVAAAGVGVGGAAADQPNPTYLTKPQFTSDHSLQSSTDELADGTATVASLPSRRTVRTANAKYSDGFIFADFANLPAGDYRLCVTQPPLSQQPPAPSWTGATECDDEQIAYTFFGVFQSNPAQNTPMNGWLTADHRVRLWLQGAFNVGSRRRTCGVAPSKSIFTFRSRRGTFSTSFPYENRIERMLRPPGPVFHDRMRIVGSVDARKLTGTISSTGPDCGSWAVSFGLRSAGLGGYAPIP